MKNIFKPIIAGFKAGFAFIGRSGQITAIRTVAVFLIVALLTPIFLFNPIWQAQAQKRSNFPTQAPPPISAPPELFTVGSAESSGFSAVSSRIVSSFSSFKDYFSTPQLPKGFEIVKAPSRSERIISSLGTSLGSIFGLVYTPAAKNNEPIVPSNPNSTNLLFGQLSNAVDFDFDGDQKADIARWHASNTEWKIKKSSSGSYQTETIGSSSAVIAPGDFDGDGKSDVALFNAGAWTIKKSLTNTTITPSFGSSGDKPVVGDYDGDGKSDLAIFRPSTNTWWIYKSSDLSTVSSSFGVAGDITVQGKFDNDNLTDIAVFRPSTGDWHISGSTAGYYSVHWGAAGDIPVPADYDDDDKTDLAVFRGSTGTWYVLKSSTSYASYQSQVWGNFGDQPVPADYDGDGKADYAIWRPTTGTWYTIKSNGSGYETQTLGVSGDTAVSSAYLKQIGGYVYSYDFAKVRLSPKNSTGGTDLYSRNFSWGAGLVGLPGRAGLDAGFGISYNSLIWTKDTTNNTIVFDADNSNVTPGFRFGFPTIEPVYFDASTGKYSYMMVSPSGARVEFRQTAASDTYETADSSYTQLKINGSGDPDDPADSLTITLTNTSGTNMLYEWKNGVYRCQKITDRNGNYIEINHNTYGQLETVTDTLGRVITVGYNGDGLPGSITQTWKGANGSGSNVTRTYATFTYTTQAITTNFSENSVPLTVIGPGDGYSVKVLQKITFPTETNGAGPHTDFTYNTWGQVTKVTNYAADNHELNHVETNLPATASSSESDCPRFDKTWNWAENFNVVSGTAQPIEISNDTYENEDYDVGGHSGTTTMIEVSMTGHPHGAVSKTFVGSSGWKEGLPIATEDWADGTSSLERKRWTWNEWKQDDTNLSYIQNPRVTESKVGDSSNIKKTKIYYEPQGSTTVANYGRVNKVEVYNAAGTAVWKQIETEYSNNSAYLSRRLVDLPTQVKVSGYDQSASLLKLVSMMTYQYDEGDFTTDTSGTQNITSVIKHDSAFSSSFVVGRGNLTSTTRCDTTYTTSCTNGITSSVKYDIAGNAVAQISPSATTTPRKIKISYADNFTDTTTSRYTYAYPTKIYDSAENYSEVKYRFDIGANVWAKSPDLNSTVSGKVSTRVFDSVGRIQKQAVLNNSSEYSYTRYVYPTNQIQSISYSTIIDTNNNGVGDTADEVLSESWSDGAGRILKSRNSLPNSTGGWVGSLVEYNILGQVKRSTVPTEISVPNVNNPDSWVPAGDDYRLDGSSNVTFLWTYQKYDWKGRAIRKINTDGLDSPVLNDSDQLISYEGCGCAGGQVTTVQGELVPREDQPNTNARRTQKVYEDILGRAYMTESLNWDGSVYSSSLTTFDGADRPLTVQQFAGTADISHAHITTTMTYDGFGRLKTHHRPEQDANTNTVYEYKPDGSAASITDSRGVETAYTYNNPYGLLTNIAYNVPSSQSSTIPATPPVTITYDNLGNRTAISDTTSSTTYSYDQFLRIASETKQYTGISTNYTFDYTYELSGDLKTLTQDNNATANYQYDAIGRLNKVTETVSGNTSTIVDDIQYRSWGAVKKIKSFTAHEINHSYDNRLQLSQTSVTDPLGRKGHNRTSPDEYATQFEYYKDGRIKRAETTTAMFGDINEYEFFPDRIYKYDAFGRLKSDSIVSYSPSHSSHVYEYDVWGNNIYSYGAFWYQNIGAGVQNRPYVNNRNPDNSYDADGRLLKDGYYSPIRNGVLVGAQNERKYDAAGRMVEIRYGMDGDESQYPNVPRLNLRDGYLYDSEGRLLRDSRLNLDNTPQFDSRKVYSTVTGEDMSVSGAGRKVVIGGGLESFRADSCSTYLTDCNSLGYDQPITGTKYGFTNHKLPQGPNEWSSSDLHVGESDALGNSFPMKNPDPYVPPNFPYDPNMQPADMANFYGNDYGGDPRGLADRCTMDGQMTNCNDVIDAINNDIGMQCPNNDCSPKNVRYNGKRTWATFKAFGDGFGGYVPNNARYIGNGLVAPSGPSVRGKFRRHDTDLSKFNNADDNEKDLGIAPKDMVMGLQDGKTIYPISQAEREQFVDELKQTLEDPKCSSFISNILKRLNNKSSLVQIFEDLVKKFTRAKTVLGNLGETQSFGFDASTNRRMYETRLYDHGYYGILSYSNSVIQTLIHEIIHISNGVGNPKIQHSQMAELANAAATELGLNPGLIPKRSDFDVGPKEDEKFDHASSTYFDDILNGVCPGRRPRLR